MGLPTATNFAKGTLSQGYDSAATSITVLSGDGGKFPSVYVFYMVWWNATDFPSNPEDDPQREIVKVTNRATDTFTIVRGQDGTTAQNHNTAAKVYKVMLAFINAMYLELVNHVAGPEIAISGGTPDVSAGNNFVLTQTDFVDVTNYVGGYEGKRIYIRHGDNRSTIKHGTNFALAGSADDPAPIGGQRGYKYGGAKWHEFIGRVNP